MNQKHKIMKNATFCGEKMQIVQHISGIHEIYLLTEYMKYSHWVVTVSASYISDGWLLNVLALHLLSDPHSLPHQASISCT
jgi:hypothetical protein